MGKRNHWECVRELVGPQMLGEMFFSWVTWSICTALCVLSSAML